NLRGRLVSFFQLAIVIGILLTYVVNYQLAAAANAWRIMFLFGIIPAVILFIGLLFLPDSPRWLIARGKERQAMKALAKLRGANYQAEFNEIKNTLVLEHNKTANWNALFTTTNLPIISIAIIIMLLQQLSGINAIIYYAPQIFMHAGLGVNHSLFSTILVGVVNLVSTLIGLFLLDKLGRRPLMILGSLLMALALATVAITLTGNPSVTLAYVGISAVLVYIFAFAISTGLFGWLIIAEIFPLNVRGEGAAIGATANWVFNILVSFSFPLLLEKAGISLIFAGFAIVCVISFFYCLKFLPETKGVSLETIETNLLKGVKSRHLGNK
ncbi:MAG: sugar porter family MFS transporter, partial [Burkholderiales bacterium]